LYVRKSPLGKFTDIFFGLVCCRWEVTIAAVPLSAGSSSIPGMDDAVGTAGGDVTGSTSVPAMDAVKTAVGDVSGSTPIQVMDDVVKTAGGDVAGFTSGVFKRTHFRIASAC